MIQQYPVITILGRRGNGKSVTATMMADTYNKEGLTVFCNYELYDIPYIPVTVKTVSEFPEWLHDGIIIIDEAHVNLDSYDFFKTRVKEFNDFITQIRKRRITLILISQKFSSVAKRARGQTDLIIECHKSEKEGFIKVLVFDYSGEIEENDGLVSEFDFDGRLYYDKYDTNQIIKSED